METWDAIRARRDVRSYTDQSIGQAELDRILEAGRRAPSARNWQPWDFVVVTDRAELTELARVSPSASHAFRCRILGRRRVGLALFPRRTDDGSESRRQVRRLVEEEIRAATARATQAGWQANLARTYVGTTTVDLEIQCIRIGSTQLAGGICGDVGARAWIRRRQPSRRHFEPAGRLPAEERRAVQRGRCDDRVHRSL